MHTGSCHTVCVAKSDAMRQAGAVDVLWMILAIGVCAALGYLGYRIEPHHVSKDGSRFLCTGQWISPQGDPDGRRREVWVEVLNRMVSYRSTSNASCATT